MQRRKKLYLIGGILLLATALPMAQAQDKVLSNQYPDAHQVTLYDSTTVDVEESGLSRVVNHKLIEMLDRKGCGQNSCVTVDYDPLSAFVEFRLVAVHRANGRIDTLVDANRQTTVCDYVAPARLIYWGASQKMVETGHLEPGDAIETITFRKGYTYALLQSSSSAVPPLPDMEGDERYIPPMRGHFYDIVPFWSEAPVVQKVYSVEIADAKKLQYQFYNATVQPTIEAIGEGRSRYTFQLSDIRPIKREPHMVATNDVAPKLLLSTSPDWKAKSRWFFGVNEEYGSFESTPELKAKVRELLEGKAHSETDSISILTHWVADNMRYCGISMGEGEGYTLHNAEMNFTDRCGVCKDKASLLIAMLRAAGFRAYAAMTMAGERIEDIPADQFNHSVCAVQRRDGRFEMLDPTWVPNVRELWSSAEQQQGYLIGLPQGANLMYTPTSPAEQHYLRLTGESSIRKDGTLVGTFTLTAEGQSDAAVRRMFGRHSEWHTNIERMLTSVDSRVEILNVMYTDPDRYLEQPFSITYQYRIPNYATVTEDAVIFIPLLAQCPFRNAMSHLSFDVDVPKRDYPFTTRCSQLIEINETIHLPSRYSHFNYAGEVRGVVDPAANFGGGYQLDDKTLTFGESIRLNKRIYDATDWPAFREVVRNQKTMMTTPVILTK
ncbi:MAG: DUF3857 and transglutaminase domain-containing protein [Bacteroidales bacterium]|nr:DUF3857 and transglutaminase domain-containing protein [Bacteroidales bacterium]